MALILQEVSTEREIEIPEPVRDVYRQWRPTPLYRARRLETALQTPARIYYKYEGVSPAGSHKPNTAVPQAFYNKRGRREEARHRDRRRPVGQLARLRRRAVRHRRPGVHGARVLRPEAVPPRADGDLRRALRRRRRRTETQSGRAILAQRADHPGSLGIAISEAVEVAAQRDDTKYALGSVLNHVLLHQTVIGQEAMAQMEMADDYPDVIVGCTGGGSNFAGIAFPFIGAQLRGGRKVDIVAVEPAACPSLTRGTLRLRLRRHRAPDAAHQDAHAGLDVHAAGLPRRRPALPRHGAAGVAPEGAGADRARAPITRSKCFEAGVQFARAEGIVPAPEANHAVQGRDRRGDPLPRGRRVARDPVQPVRPRPLRHAGLHRLLRRQAAGPRLRRSRARDGAGRAAVGQPSRRSSEGRGRPPGGRRRAGVALAVARSPPKPYDAVQHRAWRRWRRASSRPQRTGRHREGPACRRSRTAPGRRR